MINRREFLGTLGLAALAGGSGLAACGGLSRQPEAPPEACCWDDGVAPKRIAVVGDTQRTGLLEQRFLGRRQNDAEREAVLAAIAAQRPDMLLIVGDQVVSGDDEDWAYFDRIMAPIREAAIPTLGMLGNHDYDGGDIGRSLANFCARFPHQRDRMHGVTRLGGVALVTLDSNFDRLNRRAIERQESRYDLALSALDADPAVHTVIVASHHPPYTNSDMAGTENVDTVEQKYAPRFLAARKTRLYLSGHVHSYERFAKDGKSFVITGGGGGPRREVSVDPDRRYDYDQYHRGTLRPFHFLMLTVATGGLSAEVHMLQPREHWVFEVGDRFTA